LVLIMAAVSIILYALSIYLAFPQFQGNRLVDPLAELHALSPLYYAALIIMVGAGVAVWLWRLGSKYLQVVLLMTLTVMLWLTPYLLTGYVRFSDSTWHVGIATQIPEVLAGRTIALSNYAWASPGSFIYHYSAINILGMQPLTYIQFFPLFSLLMWVLLGYILLSRVFSRKAAFLALLLAVPGLHYIQIHASPHAIGALLLLTSLALLTRPGAAAKVSALIVIIIIIVSHPTTPLLLAIFLAAALVMITVYSRKISRTQIALASILVVSFAGWLYFFSHSALPPGINTKPEPVPVSVPVVQEPYPSLTDRLVPDDLDTSQQFIQGSPFIYQNIYNLNKGIYFLYGAAAILGLLYILVRTYPRKRNLKGWLLRLGGLKRGELLAVISIPLLLLLTLLLAEQAHDLIETGLTYIIIILACIIASVFTRPFLMKKKIAPYLLTVMALLSTLTYPVIAYSIDAYSSPPASEEQGLKFLAADVSLEGKTLIESFGTQLALYLPPGTKKVTLAGMGSPKYKPDLAVFRNTGYYYLAMRLNLSFEDNNFTRMLASIESQKYFKVYSSPTFLIYLKGQGKK
jgi:hypothetical protein